jgi:hypothetical protein
MESGMDKGREVMSESQDNRREEEKKSGREEKSVYKLGVRDPLK